MNLTPSQVIAFRVNALINEGSSFTDAVDAIAAESNLSTEYVTNSALGLIND